MLSSIIIFQSKCNISRNVYSKKYIRLKIIWTHCTMDERVTIGEKFFFLRRRIEYAVSTVRTIIFLELIYGRALWLTLFSPPAVPHRVDRFPDALQARLNQRGTRYHPPRDWW